MIVLLLKMCVHCLVSALASYVGLNLLCLMMVCTSSQHLWHFLFFSKCVLIYLKDYNTNVIFLPYFTVIHLCYNWATILKGNVLIYVICSPKFLYHVLSVLCRIYSSVISSVIPWLSTWTVCLYFTLFDVYEIIAIIQ